VIDHCRISEYYSSVFVNISGLTLQDKGIRFISILKEIHMFSTPYPTIPQVQAYATQAHRIRGRVVASLIRDLARWVSAAAR
jgi:hypothetical protein